jgi:DNA-binding HxlR family transcriptional regulator
VEACTEAIGGKWKGKILYILFMGKKRFGELRKLVPDATQRMLTLQLRELEEDGIIERKVFPVVPPKVEYSIVDAMWQWGKEFLRTVPKDRIRPSSAAGAAVERLCDAPKAKAKV